MADAISIQELIDARTDAKTLEEAVNGDAVTTVLSRLGESYPTLANALSQIDGKLDSADTQIKQGITNLFENGGLPATPFKTKALMTASALADNQYAMVTDDTVNNGLYVKTAGAWVKSTYDPLAQAKADIAKLDELLINKNGLYPFVHVKRGAIAYSSNVSIIEKNILSITVNNALPDVYYRLSYMAHKPSDPNNTDTTNNGWQFSRINKDAYKTGALEEVVLTFVRENEAKFKIVPNTGVARFNIKARDTNESFDVVFNTDDTLLGVDFEHLGNNSAQPLFQHVIDPARYKYKPDTSSLDLIDVTNITNNGNFSRGVDGWVAVNGAVIDTTKFYSSPQSLKVNCAGASAQVTKTFVAIIGHKYYVSVRANMTRYVAGKIGVQIEAGSKLFFGTNTVNSGFDNFYGIINASATDGKIFAGAIESANLDGNIDDVVLVDLTAAFGLGFEPDADEFTKLINGEYLSAKSLGAASVYKAVNKGVASAEVVYPIEESRAAFISKMNLEAQKLGMANTNYANPTGLEDLAQLSTARDTLKLAVRATGYDDLVRAWSKKTYSFKAGSRTINITSTVQGAALEDTYAILGGKTGTNSGSFATANVVVIVPAPNNNLFVGCVITASGDRFAAAKQLFDIATQVANGQTPSPATVAASKACVAYVPPNNVFAYDSYFPILWGKNEDQQGYQASITKIMVAIIMLDYIDDVDAELLVTRNLANPVIQAGEKITYRDALHCMLLPSSNDMATFIAEVIGNKILNKEL